MGIGVGSLFELRNRTLEEYVGGRLNKDEYRADLAAIAVEVDRLLSTDGLASLEERAARVVAEIIADSRAQSVSVTPAKAARVEFWQGRRIDRPRRDDPQGCDAELRKVAALDSEEPDEVRMARPILEALSDESIASSAPDRVRAMAEMARAEGDPVRVPPLPDVIWIDDDRLGWEEFIGGVPCQGCGRGFLGEETGRRDNEPWPAYRERMRPVEAAFRSRHPDHGARWTVGGGPSHCRRCCPPHPLSPQQIERINQLVSRPTRAPAIEVQVRYCKTCRKPIEGNHVCELADLPKALRAVVEAILNQERGREERLAAGVGTRIGIARRSIGRGSGTRYSPDMEDTVECNPDSSSSLDELPAKPCPAGTRIDRHPANGGSRRLQINLAGLASELGYAREPRAGVSGIEQRAEEG